MPADGDIDDALDREVVSLRRLILRGIIALRSARP
jgi:hypothetical protein